MFAVFASCIGAVYKAMSAEIGVSKTAVYDKLNRLEPSVSKALVKSTALDLATIIHWVRLFWSKEIKRLTIFPGLETYWHDCA